MAHRNSGNDAEHFTGVDGLAFFGVKILDCATFRRANFVLHLHRFDNEEALAGFDFISYLDEEAHHLAGHRSDDLLAALGFPGAMPTTLPGTRIRNLRGEFLHPGLECEHAVWRHHNMNFVRLAIEKYRQRVGVDLDGVGIDRLAV